MLLEDRMEKGIYTQSFRSFPVAFEKGLYLQHEFGGKRLIVLREFILEMIQGQPQTFSNPPCKILCPRLSLETDRPVLVVELSCERIKEGVLLCFLDQRPFELSQKHAFPGTDVGKLLHPREDALV